MQLSLGNKNEFNKTHTQTHTHTVSLEFLHLVFLLIILGFSLVQY